MDEPEMMVVVNNTAYKIRASTGEDAIIIAMKKYNQSWFDIQREYDKASDEDKKLYDEEKLRAEPDIQKVFVYQLEV